MTYLDHGPDRAHLIQVPTLLWLNHFIFMAVIKV